MYTIKNNSAQKVLDIISKQYCTTSDLMVLTNSGKNTCLKLKRQLKEQLEQENYFLPKSVLPMDKVVDFLKINIPYLKNVSDFESKESEDK